jgi:hypothetical protein
MSYVSINGLHMLAVEAGILLATTVLAFLFLRFFRSTVACPRWLSAILARSWRAVLLVVVVALVGRALLLPWIGIPYPRIDDEYSYLLMGDTFAHGRLSNPTPPSWQHFETFHINLTPTYHSKYPVSQGLVLAVGEVIFHKPWIGIYLSTALLCGAICWTLQAFVSAGWALLGGLFAAFRLALFSYWMNSYWGGSVAALAGALALGALVRLFQPSRLPRERVKLSCLFAASLLVLATSRPYEGFAFAVPLVVYFAYKLTVGVGSHQLQMRSTLLPFLVIGMLGASWMGYYNKRTTGNPLLLPHLLNERVYSPLPLFFWEKPKPDLTFRDPVFKKFYEVTREEYAYEDTKTVGGVLSIEATRLATNWFFYCGLALSFPVIIGLLSSWRTESGRVAIFAAASMAIAVSLCTYTMFHYAAPATVTVYLFAVEGLRYLWEQQSTGERAFVVAVCCTVLIGTLTRETGSAAVNSVFTFPDNRRLIERQLNDQPGKQLVLVSYDIEHHYPGEELVHNWADLGEQKILWARSKGPGRDADLCDFYSDRSFWSVTSNDLTYSLKPLDLCHNRGQSTNFSAQ